MFRTSVPKDTDRKYFRRTASRTKSVNVGAHIFRGGIRF